MTTVKGEIVGNESSSVKTDCNQQKGITEKNTRVTLSPWESLSKCMGVR